MYQKRLLDQVLSQFKNSKYAILVEGAKGTGKTTTCKQFTTEVYYLDKKLTRDVISSDPELMFSGQSSILIDEWQRVPEIWEVVRRKVDEGSYKGKIYLTGSSPSLQPQIHSGAGRIIRFKMRPLSFEERGLDKVKIRLSNLLELQVEEKFTYFTEVTLEHYLDEIYKSGFPGIRDEPQEVVSSLIASYVDSILHHDILEPAGKIRKPYALKKWLAAFASATATNATGKTISEAAFINGEGSISDKTIGLYKELLIGIGVIEEVQAWFFLGSVNTNLAKTSKHFLVDPALAVSLLNVSSKNIILGRRLPRTIGSLTKTFLGQLFESLVYQSLATYCQVNRADLSYFRLRNGSKEIDFIIQKEDVIVAIEVKSKANIETKDVAALNWFEEKVKEEFDVVKVIINVGPYAYKRKDNVLVIPLALFGC